MQIYGFIWSSCAAMMVSTFCMLELDFLRNPTHDLTADDLWLDLSNKLQQKHFDAIIAAPPCNTHSRARRNVCQPGPRPLRSQDYPLGFPWLNTRDAHKAQAANLLIDRSLAACSVMISLQRVFLLEHPEQLGISSGLVPASIWELPAFGTLLDEGACTAAIFQCTFNAPTSKPTRLAVSREKFADEAGLLQYKGMPRLRADGTYAGPLPKTCPHQSHQDSLIGKMPDGSWRTAPAAAYPPMLCKAMASYLWHAFKATAPSLSSKGDEGEEEQTAEMEEEENELDNKQMQRMLSEQIICKEDLAFPGRLEGAAKHNRGLPMTCNWQNRKKSFADGFGLNSPGRWRPQDRGMGLSGDAGRFTDRLALVVRTFVLKHVRDLARSSFQLATRNMGSPPFSEEQLSELRGEWFKLLPKDPRMARVEEHQPFYLHALAATLREMGDEDHEIIDQHPGDNYVLGRRVGVETPIPRAPLVFRPRLKSQRYDESSFRPISENYSSVQEHEQKIREQFAEEERLGFVYPLSNKVAEQRFGDRLRVASLAAIPKDGSDAVRILFDGTHGVQVNNMMHYDDQLEFVTPAEIATSMEESQSDGTAVVFEVGGDISKAHRRFRHHEDDHGYLCCRINAADGVTWVNRVGAFGVACAALHFGRLIGAVGRVVIRLLKRQPCWQLIFADDVKFSVWGSAKFLNLWVLLAAWMMLGAPMTWAKFRGGFALDFVGLD